MTSRLVTLLVLLVLAGCASSTGDRCARGECAATPDGGGGSDASAVTSGDAGTDASEGDASCGGAGIPVRGTPPRVLVLFDRSCSMRRRVDDGTMFASGTEDPASRWYVAREALRSLITEFGTRVHWGLVMFPEAVEECGVSPSIRVEPAAGGGTRVMSELDGADASPFTRCPPPGTAWTPGQQVQITPTEAALEAALAAGATHLLLVTDGGATCDATAASLAGDTAALRAAGTRTAVIGFTLTSEFEAAAPMLEAIAEVGGLPAAGPRPFYTADTAAELAAAFETIVRDSVSCSFTLESRPPDAEGVFVSLDDVAIERGEDGFEYDEARNAVDLRGASCERIRRGEVTRIGVAYGCAVPTCEPTEEICDGIDNDCDGEADEGCVF